eukprot:4785422-Prymnesium_polylepis.1
MPEDGTCLRVAAAATARGMRMAMAAQRLPLQRSFPASRGARPMRSTRHGRNQRSTRPRRTILHAVARRLPSG